MTPVERYIIRGAGNRRGEWAFIYLDEEKGTFSAISSFGNYAHIWSHRGGETLKEFLRDLEFDYFMGKTRGLERERFDFKATIKGMETFVKDQRRQGALSKEEARDAWDDIEALEYGDSVDLFVADVYDSDAICTAYGHDFEGVIVNSPDPQCVGFWEAIWPEFLKQLPA